MLAITAGQQFGGLPLRQLRDEAPGHPGGFFVSGSWRQLRGRGLDDTPEATHLLDQSPRIGGEPAEQFDHGAMVCEHGDVRQPHGDGLVVEDTIARPSRLFQALAHLLARAP